MVNTALILVSQPRTDEPASPRALLQAGGLSLLERLLRQLKKHHIEKVHVLAQGFSAELSRAIAGCKRGPETVALHTSPLEVARAVEAEQNVLLIEDGVLIDDRILKAVIAAPAPAAVAINPPGGEGAAHKLHHGARAMPFGSVAKVGGQLIFSRASRADADAFFPSLLNAALEESRAALIDLSAMDLYIPDRRREVALLWRPLAARAEEKAATKQLIAMAQKGCLDWPARFIHPPIENFITRQLLPWPVTPNQVTLATGLFGFFGTYLFANGELLWGLLIALILGPLDGIDGKLARTKMLISRLGELEHILDKFVEYSWFIAIAYHLSQTGHGQAPYVLAALAISFAWAEVVQGEFFRRLSGMQLDDAGPVERRIRLISGRRNTFFWALVPFAYFGAWMAGLWMLAIYSMLTFFVAQWRFIVQLRAYTSGMSTVIAKNFKDSAYFSPKPARK